jgi:plasmid stability protein
MAQVIIRNLEEQIVSRLRTRARLHGKSLEQELRDVLNAAASLTTEEKLAVIDEFRSRTPPGPAIDAAELVRQGREARMRRILGEDE